MVKCLECGKELGRLSVLHLKKCTQNSNYTIQVYKNKFPGAKIQDDFNKTWREENKEAFKLNCSKGGKISCSISKHQSKRSKLLSIEQRRKNMHTTLVKLEKNRITKPHEKVLNELLIRGYKPKVEYYFNKRFHLDLSFPDIKLAIEINGDYWHCNPKFYSSPINKVQEQNIRNDIRRRTYLKACKWVLAEFWENEINEDVKQVVDQIEIILKKSIKQ